MSPPELKYDLESLRVTNKANIFPTESFAPNNWYLMSL